MLSSRANSCRVLSKIFCVNGKPFLQAFTSSDFPHCQRVVAKVAVRSFSSDTSQMKAVLNTGYGELSKTLTVGKCHIPDFDPASAMVLVKVHAAAINPVDYKVMLGHMKPFLGELKNFPRVVGCDVSGVVVKAGSACKWAKAGDRIFADWSGNLAGMGSGTLAEYTVMPEAFASIAPSNLSFVQAAAIPLAGLTAYQALKHKGGLEKGMKVLVLGGSGGTGTFALVCAKNL